MSECSYHGATFRSWTDGWTDGPYLEGELARVVVHATGMHQRQGVAHRGTVEYLLVRDRTDPAISERSTYHRSRLASDFHGTQLKTEAPDIQT